MSQDKEAARKNDKAPRNGPAPLGFVAHDTVRHRLVYIRRDERTGRYRAKPIRRNSRALRQFLVALDEECR